MEVQGFTMWWHVLLLVPMLCLGSSWTLYRTLLDPLFRHLAARSFSPGPGLNIATTVAMTISVLALPPLLTTAPNADSRNLNSQFHKTPAISNPIL